MRDLSQKDYISALARHGFTPEGFMGYYRLPIADHHTCVSVLNAGFKATRRQKLAYLIKEKEHEEAKLGKEGK